jgi:hypothetical protein
MKMAQIIAQRAYVSSFRQNYASPFWEKAKKAGYIYGMTGKPDDITVITARIVK